MTFAKLLAASAVSALSFSSSALAGRIVIDASASCRAVSIGYSKVSNDEAIAKVTADAAAYICDGSTGVERAHGIAEATARAYALAVASASASCELKGDAKAHVTAQSSAIAAAKVWVAAYAEAFAGAGDCDKCSAYAESFGYIEQEVFLKAVANAEVKLDAYSTPGGGPMVLKVFDYQREIENVVVTAYAEALARAAAYKNSQGCMAMVNTNGCIYSPKPADPEMCFECKASTESLGAISEIDAIARASASAESWTCGDSVSITELETTAQALARATAVACSYSFATCKVDGGFACAFTDTEIKQAARAVAKAFADQWAGAYTCPGKETCEVTTESVVEAIGSILVTAATEASANVCLDSGSWTVAQFAVDIESAALCALAHASAEAISLPPSTCLAGGVVYAGAEEGSCPKP